MRLAGKHGKIFMMRRDVSLQQTGVLGDAGVLGDDIERGRFFFSAYVHYIIHDLCRISV
jgi:hypothetical protein